MNMSKKPKTAHYILRRKHLLYTALTLLLSFSVFFSQKIISYADYTDNSVHTIDELYAGMSNQILEHKSKVTYYLATDEVLNAVKKGSCWEGFYYHYNPDNPLLSGSYTYSLAHDGLITWGFTNKRTISVSFKYYFLKTNMDNYYNEAKRLANELRGKNDFESVKNVHDYIIERVEYDEREKDPNNTDIAGFRDNVTVCQGYSMATFSILNYMNIPCRIIIGDAGDEKEHGLHSWNIVKIDGKWYNYDATWDDIGEYGVYYKYFLKSNQDFPLHTPDISNNDYMGTISNESYKLPFKLKGSVILQNFNIFILCLVIVFDIIVVVFKKIRASRKPALPQAQASSVMPYDNGVNDPFPSPIGTVIEDDFDAFMRDSAADEPDSPMRHSDQSNSTTDIYN